mgnify:FL=1
MILPIEEYNFLIEIAEQHLSRAPEIRLLGKIARDLTEALKRAEQYIRKLEAKLQNHLTLRAENQKLKEKAIITEMYFKNMQKTNVKYKNMLEAHGLLGKSRSKDLER